MKRLKYIIALIIVLALLGGLGYTAVYGLGEDKSGSLSSINLGLDLAGGVSITYEVVGEENPSNEDMQDTINKLQRRVEQFSTESLVYQEGSNRINIEIPGVSDANAILEELGQPGNLYFISQTDSDGNENYTYSYGYSFDADGNIVMDENPVFGYVLNKTIDELKADGSIVLTGSEVDTAQAGVRQDSYGANQPVVSLEFTEEGAAAFATATEKAYANGETIAIYYDDSFLSVPTVQAVISDGKAEITGMDSYESASNLASMLRIGGLKLQLNELRSNVVGAQLGSDAIRTSLIAALVGFILIAIFMIAFFRLLGVSATIALAFYSGLIVFLLSAFEMTLTLPGIAGIILSIGMAVDANVLVFARIREELAAGKDVDAARKSGYNKALSSIIDGNITTLIVAIVLRIMGTGSIKGFAETLILGIILSMFTALVVTRGITSIFYGIGLQNVALYGKAKKAKQFPFVAKRKIFYGISCLIIIAGFVVMGVNSSRGNGAFNYSLDFVGGTSTTVTFDRELDFKTDIEDSICPDIAEAAGVTEVLPQAVSGTNQVIFKTTTLSVSQREAVENMLEEKYGVSADNIAAETISSTISGEMRGSAVQALVVALVLMLIYIWIRFKDIKFGAAAIIALAHDALMVIVAYAFTRYSVGSTFIAVVLTIIGYSINDTIVTFDRIRENAASAAKKSEIAELVDNSVSQTLTRSLFTSATTFFTVLALFVFGVADIKAFALPLMVGVVSGTYSSIFIASPMWYDFRTKFKTLFAK